MICLDPFRRALHALERSQLVCSVRFQADLEKAGFSPAEAGHYRYRVVETAIGAAVLSAICLHPVLAAAQSVAISPGTNIQTVVNAYPAGTTFLLKTGVHSMQTIRPRNGDKFVGEPGTVLSGARRLTTFQQAGRLWVAGGQTQEGMKGKGYCKAGYPLCTYPEQLFINGELLEPVASPGEIGPPNWSVAPGQWYFDYAADQIYIPYNPTGLRIETSVTPTAFEPTADNVTVSGLIIEMYAGVSQQGAINAQGRTGWIITGNEIRKNHGPGITVGSRAQVRQNYVQNNGQIGIVGSGDDILIENNEVYHNNTAHYYPLWEAGGVKFTFTSNLVVRGNFVHANGGPGLWTDQDNVNTLYENNTSDDNDWMGIIHEISYSAIIRNNIVRRNGFGYPDWIAGAGILVAGSPDVEIYGNSLDGNADGIGAMQQNRGSGAYGPYEVWNLWVHDNFIANSAGWTGLVQDVGDTAPFTSRNNRFERNHYQLGSNPLPFTWMNLELDQRGWTGFGLDTTGTFAP
jgi:parallel beta-helix repeat protein